MIAYFFFHMVHWSFILGQGWLLSNHFCKACQNCLRPSFEFVHKLHELLLYCESSRKCHHAAQTTPIWQKLFWHVLQKSLLCSHPWPNMNEQIQCTKWMYNNYTIMHWSLFDFEKLRVKPRFPFFNSYCKMYIIHCGQGWVIVICNCN